MNEEKRSNPVEEKTEKTENEIDENMSLLVYGNIKIRDIDTGELLVNKRF